MRSQIVVLPLKFWYRSVSVSFLLSDLMSSAQARCVAQKSSRFVDTSHSCCTSLIWSKIKSQHTFLCESFESHTCLCRFNSFHTGVRGCALTPRARWCSVASLLWFITDSAMFVFWHGWLWPRAPVCLDGCFYTWLSSPAIGSHPHMNVPPDESKKTHSHVHLDTRTELSGRMRWRWKSVKGGPAVRQADVYFQVMWVGWWVLWNERQSLTLAVLILLCWTWWLCAGWHLNS